MCGTTTLVPIPEWARAREWFDETHPEFGIDEEGRQCFAIDSCIVSALKAVWAAGFKTLGCCCGHGQGSGVISLDLGNDLDELVPAEHHCPKCGTIHLTYEMPQDA